MAKRRANGQPIRSKSRHVPYLINKSRQTVRYNVRPDSAQYRFTTTIHVSGFTTLPPGLCRDGRGFTGPVYYLLRQVSQAFEKPVEFYLARLLKETTATGHCGVLAPRL